MVVHYKKWFKFMVLIDITYGHTLISKDESFSSFLFTSGEFDFFVN